MASPITPSFKRTSPLLIISFAFIIAAIYSSISAAMYYLQLTSAASLELEITLRVSAACLAAACLVAMISVSLQTPSLKQINTILAGYLVAQLMSTFGDALIQTLEAFAVEHSIVWSLGVLNESLRFVVFTLIRIVFFGIPVSLGLYFAYRPRIPLGLALLVCLTYVLQIIPFWTPQFEDLNIPRIVILSSVAALPGLWLQLSAIGLLLRRYAPAILDLQYQEPDILVETEV